MIPALYLELAPGRFVIYISGRVKNFLQGPNRIAKLTLALLYLA